MLGRTPFQKSSNHLELTNSACQSWHWLLITNESMQKHFKGSTNSIAWTQKSRWPIKDEATGVMRQQRREILKDITFCKRHIFIDQETIGLETRTGFSFHPLHYYLSSKIQEFLSSNLPSPERGNSNADSKKRKRVFEAKISNSKTYTSWNKRKSWNLGRKNHILAFGLKSRKQSRRISKVQHYEIDLRKESASKAPGVS